RQYYENRGTCTAEGCQNKAHARGLCRRHHRELREAELPVCSVEGCGKPHKAQGMCVTHYERARASGEIQRIIAKPGDAAYLKECEVEGCTRRQNAKGLCTTHRRHQLAAT